MQELSDDEMRGLFSEKFANYEVATRRGIWSKVDAGLSVARRKSIVRGTAYSTVALLTMASLTMYMMSESKVSGEKMKSGVIESRVIAEQPELVSIAEPAPMEVEAVAETQPIKMSAEPVVVTRVSGHELHIAELYNFKITSPAFKKPSATSETILPPVQKQKRKFDFVINAETFLNYKHTWVNRYDNSFQFDFNSGRATGVRRLGTVVSFGARLPFRSGNIETGVNLRYYRYSIAYSERTPEVLAAREMDFSNFGAGIWADYYLTNKSYSFFAGASVQTLFGKPGQLRTSGTVAARVGYMLPVLSTEKLYVVVKPVFTYNLTSLNFGTFRSRPYFVGVEVGFRTKR